MSGTPAELIRRFFGVQEARAGLYRRFHDGFGGLMDGTLSGGRYDALCREITAEMSARSLEAIAVEEALLAAGKEAPAASIRVVQMGEKAKLNMTCTLQVLRKSAAEGRWRWQRGDDDEEEAVAAAAAAHAAAPIPDAPEDISRPGFANGNFRRKCATHSFGCGCLAAGGSAPPEPTEAEYAGAVAEATRMLEEAVVGINEALQELREELADLEEDA